MTMLATAIRAGDDATLRQLVCAEGRNEALTFQEVRAELAEADARLANIRYQASDPRVVSQTGATAVGALTITVEGVPTDLSEEAQQALSSSSAPVPLNMFDTDHHIDLRRDPGGWVVCGPLGLHR